MTHTKKVQKNVGSAAHVLADSNSTEQISGNQESPGQANEIDSLATASSKHAPTPNQLALRILEGSQAGLHERFGLNRRLVVGSDLEGDVVLMDRQAPAQLLVIEQQDEDVLIDVLDDGLCLNGQPVTRGKHLRKQLNGVWSIGNTCFELLTGTSVNADRKMSHRLGTEPEQTEDESLDDDTTEPSLSNGNSSIGAMPNTGLNQRLSQGQHFIPTSSNRSDEDRLNPELSIDPETCRPSANTLTRVFGLTAPVTRGFKYISAGLVLVLISLLSTWLVRPGTDVSNDVIALNEADVLQFLTSKGFDSLEVVRGADGRMQIIGYVPTRSSQLELSTLVKQLDSSIDVAAFVDKEVLAGVKDVFRVHDIDAELSSDGKGRVVAVSRESEDTDFLAIKHAAREDVAGLVSLDVRNMPPPVQTEPKPEESYAVVNEPVGKRVMAIVQGAPSYVITEDDTRYFVGSKLPTGHIITSIGMSSVMLDRQGTLTELAF